MVIIIEGNDKCGKSTLAEHIVNKYGFSHIKCSQPKGDPYIEYMSILKKIANKGGHWVIDRFHMGESVYGPIYRGSSGLTREQIRNIELKAMSLRSIVIYCHDSARSIKERFKECNETFTNEKDIKQILHLFEVQVNISILPVVRHEMKTRNDLLLTKKIDIIISNEMDSGIYFKTITGSSNPDVIFVGEKRNENQKPEYKDVGQPFDFGPASKYLFEKLGKSKLKMYQLMFINSDSEELEEILKKTMWCNFWSPTVVALGKVASDKLSKINVDHIDISHPQYMARFFNKSDEFLNKLLKIPIYENSKTIRRRII